MPASSPQTSPAARCAGEIRDAFFAYDEGFGVITRRARATFERRDWAQAREDAVERIDLYDRCVSASADRVRELFGDRVLDRDLWRETKRCFRGLVEQDTAIELTQTYFSSVTRRVFDTIGIDPEIEFVHGEATPLCNVRGAPATRNYVNQGSLEAMFRALLDDYSWDTPYVDPDDCARSIATQVEHHYRQFEDADTVLCIDVMEAVFYRDTRAYVLGRAVGWNRTTPLAIAFENSDEGIRVDAVIQSVQGFSILFGFARAYFHADLDSVGSTMVFLKGMLPRKPLSELFTALGRAKQGKTERFRDLAQHLERSHDQFITAPGDKGMVMVVFTLPSYDTVFKVIRDRFAPPKNTTREKVRSRYHLVSRHDRVGRLIDTQEFRLLRLRRDRFDPELLDELLTSASETVWLENGHVVLAHAYIERRLRPLNLYLREVDRHRALRAVQDYGQSLRDLAATNIFPGDLLLKNFGVSRHGRVIFYDYDELCLVTDCNFRDLPKPRHHDDEMSAEPWFYVADNDIFPEEIPKFLGLRPELRKELMGWHGELFTAAYWQDVQRRIEAGEAPEVLPY